MAALLPQHGDDVTAKVTLLDLWREAWLWMQSVGIPLEAYQIAEIAKFELPDGYVSTPHREAYYITEHFEGMRKHARKMLDAYNVPEDVAAAITAYKLKMMEIWGWPEWGYRDVERPQDGT